MVAKGLTFLSQIEEISPNLFTLTITYYNVKDNS